DQPCLPPLALVSCASESEKLLMLAVLSRESITALTCFETWCECPDPWCDLLCWQFAVCFTRHCPVSPAPPAVALRLATFVRLIVSFFFVFFFVGIASLLIDCENAWSPSYIESRDLRRRLTKLPSGRTCAAGYPQRRAIDSGRLAGAYRATANSPVAVGERAP